MLSSGIWARPPRGGHRLTFFALDREIQQWLADGLPTELGPYSVFGLEQIIAEKRPSDRAWRVFECGISELVPNLNPVGRWRGNFWIRSTKLSPTLEDLLARGDLDGQCAVNGLILLQYGGVDHQQRRLGSSLVHVNKVANQATGEVIEHEQYFAAYKRLRRQVKKGLVYSVLYPSTDGVEYEEINAMTDGAYNEAISGIAYTLKPGRRCM